MKRRMALTLGICLLSSSLYGCSSAATSTKVYAAEDIDRYNEDIVEVCNYEAMGEEISADNKVAKTNIETLKNSINNHSTNYLIELSDMDSYLYEVRSTAIGTYGSNKYIKESTDLGNDDYEDNDEFLEEQEIYFELAKGIRDDINRISKVKDKDFVKYLDFVYGLCNRYNELPENYKNIIPNKSTLIYEVESLGGKIDKNFNIEKQKYLYEVKKITQNDSELELDIETDKTFMDGDIEPYTGVSDEELGLAETFSSDSPYGRKRGENYLESTEIESESIIDESNIEFNESTEEFAEETTDEAIDEIETFEESTEAVTEMTLAETESSTYMQSENYESETSYNENTFSSALNENVKTLEELSAENNIPVEIYRMIKDGGNQFELELDIQDIREYILKKDNKLSYNGDNWYINLEGAPETGEIDLIGGYYISWIIEKKEPTKFSLTDYIYWDTNGFKVRCINESGRIVELEGYISDDTIFINNIESIIDKVNPARAYVYQRDIKREEDYYEESMEESVEETLEDSIETSTEDIEESASEE